DRRDGAGPRGELRGRVLVLEVGATDQDARAIWATNNDVHFLGRGGRHQALQGALVIEQRVAAGQKEAVWSRLGHVQRQFARLDGVHAEAPGLDNAPLAQLGERAERPRACGLEPGEPLVAVEVTREVVNPHEVQPVDAEALEAVLDRAQRAVRRVVIDHAVGPAELEEVPLLAEVPRSRFHLVDDQPADLGTEHVLVALAFGQRPAQAHLGQAGAVQWRRVEVADALLPGGIDGGGRLLLGDVAEHVAQRRGTEAQRAAEFVPDAHDSSTVAVSRQPSSLLTFTKRFGWTRIRPASGHRISSSLA